ncbi:MAG: DUF6288 domain-containing protein [Verrucomicrobiota bacterium]
MLKLSIFRSLAIASLLITSLHAAPKGSMTNPDFTKGDAIPAGANHDWTLGATGTRGWMYSEKLGTTEARQIRITKVDPKSPADGKLAVGDVILGVGGKPFSYDPRTEFGKALTAAEAADGKLSLTRWKKGSTDQVVLELPVLGTYSKTAPYNCEKSKKIFEAGCEALAARMQSDPNYARQNPISRSLNAIALLASGNPKYMELIKKEVEWAKGFSADGMASWYYGYVMMLLAEYTMATGDTSALAGLERIALEASIGQSKVGSWGHKFAAPDGRLYGYGMMNAPGVPLTTGLVLAKQAGLNKPEIDLAIERSTKLIRFYKGKGSIPYGDHTPWIQNHDDNGKNGMAAVLFSLLDETQEAEYFSRMSLACHGSERDTGHTGNFWNMTWAVPGVVQSGPHATGAWMKEFGSWYFDLARRWDGTFTHQGPPQMDLDSTRGWDSTGAYLLAYAMPRKAIVLTGKRPTKVPQLDEKSAQAIIADGRGWSNKDRNSAYDSLTGDELFEKLGSWSPIVRDRAAMALARKKDVPVDKLIEMLDSPNLYARYGACDALGSQKSATAVPSLVKTLKHEDMWLRIKAAEALGKIGEPGMVALPEILTMLAKGATPADPRAMEQRFLSSVVFGQMLKKSIAGVDRQLLQKAIEAGLTNEDGRARSEVANVYTKYTYEEIRPLLPSILEAIVKPAPSGEMFASGVRISGLELLAKHKIKEGLPLIIEVMDIQSWGKAGRFPRCLSVIEAYGAGAKSILPDLRQLEQDLIKHSEAKGLKVHTDRLHTIIQKIEASTEAVELRSLK